MGTNKKKKGNKKKASQVAPASSAKKPTASTIPSPSQSSESSSLNHTTSAPTEATSEASSAEKTALQWKEEGNAAFSNKKLDQAIHAYTEGLQVTDDDTIDLRCNLLSNRAMIYFRQGHLNKSIEDCSRVIDEYPSHATPKVWFRRAQARDAQARQAQASNGSTTVDQARQKWQQAATDLAQALKLLETSTAKDVNNMKTTVVQLAVRVRKSLQSLDDDKKSSASQPRTRTSSRKNNIISNLPPVEQQREDVLRLLTARQAGLQQQQHTNGDDTAATAIGEAFFLMDWEWWCDWCDYVNVLQTKNGSSTTAANFLKLLPPGAVLPTPITDEDDEDDGSPGVIDNTHLFLIPPDVGDQKNGDWSSQHVFYQQWYGRAAAEQDDEVVLKPNLVRGYDYEVLPREVYFALVSWYGEVTPNICRRTVVSKNSRGGVVLKLYPLPGDPSPSGPASAEATVTRRKCGACRAILHNQLRCTRCMKVYYCDRSCQESHWPFHKGDCKTMVVTKEANGDGEHFKNTDIDQLPALSDGRVGLNNLGNTCFMNSAIQCLSHATPLTRHFLSNKFRTDLHTSNPLGNGGRLAVAYETVVKDLWMRLVRGSTSPSTLKRAIALFAPRFAGCLQHDAQEFLAYLLDGLHEDLNRIRKAPYVEMPDVSDGQNMAVAGARAWDAHKRRNDSLVMDTFYGQFQSFIVCPKCKRVSVSFDAFNHVSLEIPQKKNGVANILVLFCPRRTPECPAAKPVRYGFQLSRSSLVLDLKRELSQRTGIPVERLALCEVIDCTIMEIIHDKKPVSEIQHAELLTAYEIHPFQGPKCFHVVATHKFVDPSADKEDPALNKMVSRGIPLLTSFPPETTCKQAWNHIWQQVARLVQDKEAGARNLLQIQVLNGPNQQLLKVFPVESRVDESTAEGDEDAADSSSHRVACIPKDSDDELVKYLGVESVDRYLMLRLEWRDSTGVENEQDESKAAYRIDEDLFNAFEDHPSSLEVVKKTRSMNSERGVTLDQCFDAFTRPERLDENNMWYCSKCKEHVRAMKTMQLWRLPNVLVVQLKRFEFKHVLRRDKLDTLVDFPLEGLDMSAHCVSSNESDFVDGSVPAVYDLFAVINHYGRMGFGHYTAFARRWDETGISSDWALFDDSSVRSISDGTGTDIEGVVSPAAYVLFYRRRAFN